MRTADFHYALPPELIAQTPAPRRDGSRLLVLHRFDGRIEHRRFPELTGLLRAGDVLVLNDSRVLPARLRGRKPGSGGSVEILLLEENAPNDWWTMLRPGKRIRPGTRIVLQTGAGEPSVVAAVVTEKNAEGHYRLSFEGTGDLARALEVLGETPLPPYIERSRGPGPEDRERYQTVYADPAGSVAAPTAGLHFTPELLAKLCALGVEVRRVTLHVGAGTFLPVKTAEVEDHRMHRERYALEAETAAAINRAKSEGRRVVAVGTTTVRVLESVASLAPPGFRIAAGRGETDIFIYPPWRFRVVDALLTNFHLPESTLLMLVSAFAFPGATQGRERVLAAYAEAVRERYRFYSYGDAMFVA